MRSAFVVVVAGFFASLFFACPQPVGPADVDAGVIVDSGVVTCADDEQCGDGFCRGGVCVDSECQERAQCPPDKICKEGRCSEPPATCRDFTDCPGDQLCDGFTDSCFDPNGEGEGEEGEGEEGEGEGEGEEGEGEGEGEAVNLEGFRLENRETATAQVTVVPPGISLNVGQVLVIGRDATQQEFTNFWGALGAGAVYLNAEIDTSGVPIVNGDEKFTLVAPNSSVVDGPAREGAERKCYARTAQAAGADASWTESPTADATPGVVNAPNVSGLVITEWCDAEGGGNFRFEYVELANLP